MALSAQTIADRATAVKQLNGWIASPLTLQRPTYFVPGWRDEQGACWTRMEAWVRAVCANADTHAHFVQFHADGTDGPPPWEDFLDFGDDIAQMVHADTDATGQPVNFVCHSMGGLDVFAALTLIANDPALHTPVIGNAHTVITFDTPFRGFGAAKSKAFQDFVKSSRTDPWVLLQLGAMEKASKRIAAVWSARDDFLRNLADFYPRGADNFDGVLEVTHDSASFGDPPDFAPELRPRDHEYVVYRDTSHSGLANGVTNDPRAIVDAIRLLTGA